MSINWPTILVCGGRDFANMDIPKHEPEFEKMKKQYKFIFDTLDKICRDKGWMDKKGMMPQVRIVSGAARGADTAAIDWAVTRWVPFNSMPANWTEHGKAAGPIRNEAMLFEYQPRLVVAFPGGSGTAHMVKISKEANVEVIEVAYNE